MLAKRARFSWWVGAGLTLPGLLGCRQILGLDVPPDADVVASRESGSSLDAGSDGNGGACGLPFAPPICAACVSSKCCAQSSTCASDSVFCAPYEGCLAGCKGDPACRSQCTIDHPVPATNAGPVSALSACIAAQCENECSIGCGGFAGYLTEPGTAAACQMCLQQNGCSDARTCGSSVECDAFWRCFLACPTLECKQRCVAAQDAGVSAFRPLFQDFSGTCGSRCAFGNYWACVGHIGYPAAQSNTVTWTNWVYDVATQQPVADASVSVCTGCPCPTASYPVLAQSQTGADGFFTVQFPETRNPSGQPQNVCIQTIADGYLRNFLYPGFPFAYASSSIKDSLEPLVALGQVLFTPGNEQQDIMMVGGTPDSSRGMIAAGIFDCLANPADGVYVTLQSSDPAILPVFPVPGDAGPMTLSGGVNTSGHAVFLQVAPGSYTLTARPPGFDKPIDSVTVNVAAATLTQLGLFPAPSSP